MHTSLFLLLLLPTETLELGLAETLSRARAADTRQVLSALEEEDARLAAHQGLSRVLPAAGISAQLQRNAAEIVVGQPPNERVVTPLLQPSANGRASMMLLRGGDIPNAIAGYTDAAATELEQREAREALAADVAQTYVQLAHAQEKVQVMEAQRATAQELMRLADVRVKAGDAVALEVDEARSELLRTEAALANAQGDAEQVSAQLALRLGLAPDAELRARCDVCITPPEDATAGRGDIKGLRLRAEAAELRGWGAWMAFVPSLEVVGNARLQEPTLFNPNLVWWNAQLVASWSLFEGGGRWFSRERAGTLAERKRRQADLAKREQEVQIVQARSALRAAETAAAAATARTEVAGRALGYAQLRYREGLLSSFGVQESARRMAEAQGAAVDARARRVLSALSLRRALGQPVLDDAADLNDATDGERP